MGKLFLRLVFWLIAGIFRGIFVVVRCALKGLLWSGRRAFARRLSSHGSARWATLWDVVKGGAWGGCRGVIVGKYRSRFVLTKAAATLVYAPMGKGKGVSVVIPNILNHRGAVLTTDPKGENFAVTARHRATLGPVFRLDAIQPEGSDRINPLHMIRRGTPFEADDAAMIAEFLVVAESHEAHWDTSAKSLIANVIRHLLATAPPALQTLSTVREMIAADAGRLQQLFTDMAASPMSSVAEEARAILASLDTDEAKSVIKNAAKALAFWSKDRIGGQLTAASDFEFDDLNRFTLSIYVMVPDDNIEVYAPLLRVISGCAVAALMRSKDRPAPKHKPLLMLDECAAMGRLVALERAVGMLRAYAHMVLIFQDLGQLRAIYGERARSFIAAAGCQVAFGISDPETARDVADTIGRTTVLSRSQGLSHSTTELLKANLQAGLSETGRYLRDPAEVCRIPSNRCLIFMPDQVPAPILARKVRYYQEWRWHGCWDRWRTGRSPAMARQSSPPPLAGSDLDHAA